VWEPASGLRCGWIVFRDLDRERGTQYYPRIRFLLADYSFSILDAAQKTLLNHRELASFLAVDALDPFKSLSFLRYKVSTFISRTSTTTFRRTRS